MTNNSFRPIYLDNRNDRRIYEPVSNKYERETHRKNQLNSQDNQDLGNLFRRLNRSNCFFYRKRYRLMYKIHLYSEIRRDCKGIWFHLVFQF